jgi:hypothetical protein
LDTIYGYYLVASYALMIAFFKLRCYFYHINYRRHDLVLTYGLHLSTMSALCLVSMTA